MCCVDRELPEQSEAVTILAVTKTHNQTDFHECAEGADFDTTALHAVCARVQQRADRRTGQPKLLCALKCLQMNGKHAHIDLTGDDFEDDQKARIMAQASAVMALRPNGFESQKSARHAAPAAQEPIVIDSDDDLVEEQEPAKRARQHDTQHGPSSPHPPAFAQPVLYPLHDVLRALHQERQARMQQQQSGEQEEHQSPAVTGTKRRKAHQPDSEEGTKQASPRAGPQQGPASQPCVSILTYNVW